MMDVPAGNALPDPWSGAASQPVYPWRGRISCHPAPGQAGTVDGTATAASQIAAFFGTASAAHFSVAAGSVTYSGPPSGGSAATFCIARRWVRRRAGSAP